MLSLAGAFFDFLIEDNAVLKAIECAGDMEPPHEGWYFRMEMGLGIVASTMAIASYIGLVLFKNWGRITYIVSFLATLPLYPSMGVTVSSGYGQMFYDLSMMASGIVIAVAYFSKAAELFE